MNKNMIIVVVITAGLIGAAFYGGMMYQRSTVPQRGAGFAAGTGRPGTAGRTSFTMGAGAVAGSILSKDASSITVKMQDGSTKIVLTNASTSVLKTSTGSLADLSVGTNVTAVGTPNSDGSVTAVSVSIRPLGFTQGRMPTAGQ
jgi:hypothetical protein